VSGCGQRSNFMEKTRKSRKPVSAESIARLADQGKDVSRFFTNTGRMMGPGKLAEHSRPFLRECLRNRKSPQGTD